MTEAELLDEINVDLPKLDWKAGAQTYVKQARVKGAHGGRGATYSLTKPFLHIEHDSPSTALMMALELFRDFVNVLALLQLPAGARVFDVACGGGWISHYLAKLGYRATGVDVCEDLLEMAHQRVKEDPRLRVPPEFVLADIELAPLDQGEFDAAIFESCFHHFQNPIAALRNAVRSLAADGVVVLTESEIREGALKEEWVAEMYKYQTIERPFTRAQLIAILEFAGLPCYEFFAPVDGWYSPRSAEVYELSAMAASTARLQNRCVAARTPEALRRVIPWWEPSGDVQFGEGFSAGSGGKRWCGPHGCIRILRDVGEMVLEIGGQPAGAQTIAAYHGGLRKEVLLVHGERASERLQLTSLRAGDEIHLCSDFAFSPAWTGEADARLLSFWVERVA